MNATQSLFSKKSVSLMIALAGFVLPFFIHLEGLSDAGHRLLSIFLLAVILWVTEAIPLYATSSAVILLLVLMLSTASESLTWGIPEGFAKGAPDYSVYFNSLANKVLILFLGGFCLADGAAKYGVDRNLAAMMLKPFGKRPSLVLLGLMLITGILSMWMSNTATCATIMAVVLPLIHRLPEGDRFRTALALGVPFAANIGGIGTPVGTPPNAIALAALKGTASCSFVQWMTFAMPFAIILLGLGWLVLICLFPSKSKTFEVGMKSKWIKSPKAFIYYVTAATTVLLWVTENLHGINSYTVGLIPVTVLLATGVFDTDDFKALDWHVLWLVAGGIALGVGVAQTGFDAWVVGLVDWSGMGGIKLLGGMALAGLLLGTFISHSAAANLLAPMAMAVAMNTGTSTLQAVAYIAVGSSIAMALPISTPPNAIAYGSRAIQTKHMALAGGLIGSLGWVLLFFLMPHLMKLAGVL